MPKYSLGELAQQFNLELEGDPKCEVIAVAPLGRAHQGELAYVTDRKRSKELANTRASAVVLPEALRNHYQGNKLISANTHAHFARIAALLHSPIPNSGQIHPMAVISPSAQIADGVEIGANTVIGDSVTIGRGCTIGAGCVVERETQIGEDCLLHANVTLAHQVQIGDRVILHHGAVVGSDGFGLAQEGQSWLKVPQVGSVVIGNDVEIGANTTIDRGAMDDTIVGNGVKLDNLIQVAHNVRIGANTAIAACVGIAGSAAIGERCTIGGAAVVLGHLSIADDVHITAMSLVTKSISEAGTYSSGTPLEPNASWHRNFVRFKQLDEMAKRLTQLERHMRIKD